MEVMKLTAELLKRYEACDEGADWFKKTYPNGAELIEIMNNPECSLDFMHWGYRYLDYNEEEKQLYLQKARIENSRFVYNGEDVQDSMSIAYCTHIKNSKFCAHSKSVNNSSEVYNCDTIDNSNDVALSEQVKDSKYIFQSEKVKFSSYIVDSSMITTSHNILNSFIITDSAYLWQCKHTRRALLCSFSSNITNAICCAGLMDVNYQIFNAPVPAPEFMQYYTQLLLLLKKYNYPNNALKIEAGAHEAEKYDYSYTYTSMIKSLPQEILDFLKTLPNYSEEAINQILYL